MMGLVYQAYKMDLIINADGESGTVEWKMEHLESILGRTKKLLKKKEEI